MIGQSWTRAATLLALLATLGCSSSGGTNKDASPGDGGDAADTGAGLPGFGQACAPIAQQGDPQCAPGLVCISAGVEQGRSLCTKTCTTEDAPCTGGPAGTTPTCGREFQVSPSVSRVCEFFCDPSAPNCPPDTMCLVNTAGTMTCQPPIQ